MRHRETKFSERARKIASRISPRYKEKLFEELGP